eukprot:s1587_g14.t3
MWGYPDTELDKVSRQVARLDALLSRREADGLARLKAAKEDRAAFRLGRDEKRVVHPAACNSMPGYESPAVVDKDTLFTVKVLLGSLVSLVSLGYIMWLAVSEQRRRKDDKLKRKSQ